MPGDRSGARGDQAGDPGGRLGCALVRTDQGAGCARGRVAQEARITRPDRDRLRPWLPARRGLMTRRIVLTILTLIVALLGLIAVPLCLIPGSQDRRDFTGETVTAAQTLSSAAEEKLADRSDAPALSRAIARLQRRGDQVALYGRAGTRLAGSGPVAAAAGVRLVLARSVTASYPGDDRLVVLAPVLPDEGGRAIGVIALSRSTAPLQQRITALWIWL